MKKVYYISALILLMCFTFLTACSSQEDDTIAQMKKDYYVMKPEVEQIFSYEEVDNTFRLLGVQYYNGEPIQLRAEKVTVDLQSTLNIHLYGADGTDMVVLSGVPADYQQATWFLSDEGHYYVVTAGEIVKLDETGKELFHRHRDTEYSIRDICQLEDGRVILLVYDMEEKLTRVAELDTASAEISEMSHIALKEEYLQYIGRGENGLYILDRDGLSEIDLKSGNRTSIVSLTGVKYTLDSAVGDFTLSETGEIVLLQNGTKKQLHLENIADTRTVIVVRSGGFINSMESFVAQFNKENETYHVVLESGGADENLDELCERTAVEIAAGGGPDIVFGRVLTNEGDLIEKGAFVDLSAYMDKTGMKEEDFFPFTFDSWRDGDAIYAVQMSVQCVDEKISKALVGDEEITIEMLVDRLLNYQEKAVFREYWDADQLLDYFLCATEDLWGMIDWEEGTCDFSGELFEKILKVSKQYGASEENIYPALGRFRENFGYYFYETKAELESEGMRELGNLFDDGCFGAIHDYCALMINSNSPSKEGAWEFISYLLSEEVQGTFDYSGDNYPVSRKGFDAVVEREIAEGVYVVGKTAEGYSKVTFKVGREALIELGNDVEAYRALYNLTEEKAEEIRMRLETSRVFPTNTTDILAIVREEAGAYFADAKSIEEVVAVIENRVQLYLDEKE